MEVNYCLTRITNPKTTQYFADGKHKFYLEYCCCRPCIKGTNKCSSCHKIHSGARSQFDSTYPHGSINEPIPDHSHIFGGTWYQQRVSLWGAPSAEVIALAKQYQDEANRHRTSLSLSKANQPSISQEMVKPKKVETDIIGINDTQPVKRTRKPKVAATKADTVEHTVETINSSMVEPLVEPVVEPIKVPIEVPVKPKRKTSTKTTTKATKLINKDISSPIALNEQPICKEVVIPTHIEHQIETIDIDGFDIEYIPLSYIEIDRITYFRDTKKNKLYQKIKEKVIGSYVGRYCPHTGTICTEVPDSDEENDS
jgi:hypothetical protein